MTETTSKSFAYRLFHAIRANKKALLAEIPPASLSNSEGYSQREMLHRLINAMFWFERSFRGCQPALAGEHLPKCFTRTYKRDSSSHGIYLGFINEATRGAEYVVEYMLQCQALLIGPTWDLFLSLEGLPASSFKRIAREHIRTRLPGLTSAVQLRASTGVSVSFTEGFILKMEFSTGAAINKQEQHFPLPDVEGKSLEEQIQLLNLYWTGIKHYARDASKQSKNWPSLEDARAIDVKSLNSLLTQFYRGLRPEQKVLFQKYPNEVNRFFDKPM